MECGNLFFRFQLIFVEKLGVDDGMGLTVKRIAVTLLALIQFGVWSVYAPAHRLVHHSGVCNRDSSDPTNDAKFKANRARHKSAILCRHSCSHHSAELIDPSIDLDGEPRDERHECPDRDDECLTCIIAMQSGVVAISYEWSMFIECQTDQTQFNILSCTTSILHSFDSRGPPRSLSVT